MVKYTGKQSILDSALGEYADLGFRLEEPDDHVTNLYFKDKLIFTYLQNKVTAQIISEDCRSFMNLLNRRNNSIAIMVATHQGNWDSFKGG